MRHQFSTSARRVGFFFLLVFMLSAAAPGGLSPAALAHADDDVIVEVTPSVSFEPADLVVRVTVRPNDDNRAIGVSAESAEYYSSSERTLQGTDAPRVYTIVFRQLPGGTYILRGVVIGRDGHVRCSASAQAVVVGRQASTGLAATRHTS